VLGRRTWLRRKSPPLNRKSVLMT